MDSVKSDVTVHIHIDIRCMICNDYVSQIKNKAAECGFPLALTVDYPGESPIHYKVPNSSDALDKFNATMESFQKFAIECTEAETGRKVVQCGV